MTKNKKIETIADILEINLNYAYCDNCGTTDCDDCHRKYQSWSLSKNTAKYLAKIIVKALDNNIKITEE